MRLVGVLDFPKFIMNKTGKLKCTLQKLILPEEFSQPLVTCIFSFPSIKFA